MSDGTPWRPLIHVEDIADAFIAALEAPLDAIHNEAFNVGQDTENYQVRDIAETVRAVVPGCRVAYASSSGPDARSYRVDFSKLRNRIPCFRPRWNIEKGARQLHEALLEFGVTLEDFRGRRFTRLSQLQHLIREDHLAPNLRWRHSCPLKEVS